MKKLCLLFMILLTVCPCPTRAYAAASPTPTAKTIKREIKLGRKTAKEIENQMPRVLDPGQEAHLMTIAGKLLPFLERNLEYEVRIIDMKDPNAFSLPGGITYFTTGMLKFLKSDAEIAAILAHEFVHADRAHVIVQTARNNKLNIITLAGIIAATQGAGAPAMLMSSMLQTAIMNSYSIDLEKEADARGIDVLYKAGFNPAAMLTTMERLKIEHLKKNSVDPGIYQTHPDEQERVDAAIKYMKDKGIEIQRKDVVQSLKVSTTEASGDIRLTVDGYSLISLKKSERSEKLLKELSGRLDSVLELELAPFDIQVNNTGPADKTLLIRGKPILKESELISGMPTLSELRNRINDSLNSARRGNPLTDYFQ